ncbi:MAG: hypothetical protein K9L59_18195 [Desulfobacterales bacterium]|nr:hypothetical protein [Desulfobacterales bacterium]
MIRHPLMLSVAALDLLCLAALAAAVVAVFPVLVRWQPGAADSKQLAAERGAEAGVLLVRFSGAALALSTLLLIVGFSLVLPDAVPGAMCGTGVLQAAGPLGSRAIFFRLLALLGLSTWSLLEDLNRIKPEAVLTETTARVFAAISPLALLAVWYTARAMWGIDFGRPVDCCATVYDPVYAASTGTGVLSDRFWMLAFSAATLLLGAAALGVRRTDHRIRRRWSWPLGVLTLFWVTAAAGALVNVFSAYIFGVLAHDCPWCLFLPEHGMVGFLQFGALAVAAREGIPAPAASFAAFAHPLLAGPAADRIRTAAGRILLSMAVFLVFSAGPALLWRLRHGVWISG